MPEKIRIKTKRRRSVAGGKKDTSHVPSQAALIKGEKL
jgi:hypothetical protein